MQIKEVKPGMLVYTRIGQEQFAPVVVVDSFKNAYGRTMFHVRRPHLEEVLDFPRSAAQLWSKIPAF